MIRFKNQALMFDKSAVMKIKLIFLHKDVKLIRYGWIKGTSAEITWGLALRKSQYHV